MNRRNFLKMMALGSAPLLNGVTVGGPAPWLAAFMSKSASNSPEEATIAELQAAIHSGAHSSVSLVHWYLRRIEKMDRRGPMLRSVIQVNPDALAAARALDRERKTSGPRGPLHGIPVLIKDNIDTHDRMMTTAGSLALLGSIAQRDSFVAQKLREAGAVILGKSNLSEWANFRGDNSTSGWSARGGLTKNPYALDRNPSGSSSGSAVAVSASLCAAAVGTETDGSLISPGAVCGIVSIKPTVGLISRSGIIPISRTQDTAGPMTRTVTDAAILLGALTGADPRDDATEASRGKAPASYTMFLDPHGLNGARIGVARKYFGSRGISGKLLEAALDDMKRLGATLIDPADDPALDRFEGAEGTVLSYEFKAGINAYLASLGANAPVRTLQDLILFNERNGAAELRYFGQEEFLRAQERGPLTDTAYLDAWKRCRRLSRSEGIDAVMDRHRLDAIVAPAGGPAGVTDLIYGDRDVGGSSTPAAVAGYPNITVPAGDVLGLPVGISFFGRAYSEPVLLKIAFAYEQATQHRKSPRFLSSID
ncbi:MAG TPA: amidase [Candidatus Baltobacteraceae bacterium]|jgi:amidase|nr:amidase [Candidatus Baltobacteraceae bacterium]